MMVGVIGVMVVLIVVAVAVVVAWRCKRRSVSSDVFAFNRMDERSVGLLEMNDGQ